MKQYLDLLQHVMQKGAPKKDRTGTGTRSVFGHQMRFDLAEVFPLVTTKKVHFKSIVAELLWFLSGSTNNNDLEAMGCTIWRDWADENGELGPIYGRQWRSWWSNQFDEIDQIANLVIDLKTRPDDRGNIVSAWNVAQLHQMALRPCHCLFQCYVSNGRLSLQLYQRSADIFLGVPFNIASYALLTHMLAQQCDLEVGELIWTGGDCHIYANHVDQVTLQLTREPMPLPALAIARKPESIFEYKTEDFNLVGYAPHPGIKAKVAV